MALEISLHTLRDYIIEKSQSGIFYSDIKKAARSHFKDRCTSDTDFKMLDDMLDAASAEYPSLSRVEHVLESKIFFDELDTTCYEYNPRTEKLKTINEQVLRKMFTAKAYNTVMATRQNFIRSGYNPMSAEKVYVEDGQNFLNQYKAPLWLVPYLNGEAVPQQNLPEIYNEFLDHLTGGNAESKRYMLHWLAGVVNPRAARNFCFLVTIGRQGLGKGVFYHIMKELIGDSNATQIIAKEFEDSFNGKMKNKKLIYFDEIFIRSSADEDKIKKFTEATIAINEKYVVKEDVKNHANVYISSNHISAIRASQGDRRFSIIDLGETSFKDFCAVKEVRMSDYVNKVLLKPENIAAFGKYLMNLEIDEDFVNWPPETKQRHRNQSASLFDWESAFLDLCKLKAGKELTLKEAQEQLKEHANVQRLPTGSQFAKLAEKMPGIFTYSAKRSTPLANGTRPSVIEILKKDEQKEYDFNGSESAAE